MSTNTFIQADSAKSNFKTLLATYIKLQANHTDPDLDTAQTLKITKS
jgi:hypothetical protein